MDRLPGLVAFDLDGTLLNAAKQITPRTLAAVRALVDAGVIVVVASGRMYRSSIKPQALELGLDTPVIAYNGALIMDPRDDTVLFERPVPPELARPVIDYAAERDLHLQCYFDDTLYCRRVTPWLELYIRRTHAEPVVREDLYDWARERASTKLLIVDEVGDRMVVAISEPEYVEFTDPGATKGEALRRVCAWHGIDPADSAAFGDSGNDLPLLEAAGYRVAPANARPAVLAVADEVCPHHDEDGVAQALERWLARFGG
ncbi:MAG: HAD family phosphatase [Armatimonadetes bacterium]|nr:HAD family phosphatase [Armatimonadota bacterium]